MIASLGLIVLDIIHHFLLLNDSGLPLGLSGIKLTFTSLFYLVSPSFWSGIGAFGSKSTRIRIAFLLMSCGLLANFIGPSSALLLIPTNDSKWAAGGLRFRTHQNVSQIWPDELNASHIGGHDCSDPDDDVINVTGGNYSKCIWYAATILGADLNDDLPPNGNLTIDDRNIFWRYISWSTYATSNPFPTRWNWSSMSIADVITGLLFVNWGLAANGTKAVNEAYIENATIPWSFWSKYSRYSYRDPWGTRAELSGMLGPIARASCRGHWHEFNDTRPLLYPVMPLYGNYRQDTNATYTIAANLVERTSVVRTLWISIPKGNIQVVHSQGNQTDPLPSALLLLQFPLNSTTAGAVFTCSVDARWTNFTSTFDSFNDQEIPLYGVPATYARLRDTTFDIDGRPIIGQSSSPVHLDLAWLNALTPSLNKTNSENDVNSGYNTLSRALDSVPRNLSEEGLKDFLYSTSLGIEGFLPTLVVDGMARFNFHELLNGHFDSIWEHWYRDQSSDLTVLLAGGGGTDKLVPDLPVSTEFLWTVTISGYTYYADSTASNLALAVLFSYIVFALGHVCFTMYKRWTSLAWTSVPEIVTLCQDSPRSVFSRNTASGIDSKRSNHLLLKLRVPLFTGEEKETIHVLVSGNNIDPGYRKAIGHHKIDGKRRNS